MKLPSPSPENLWGHVSVMPVELVGGVLGSVDGAYVDVTGGLGGHSSFLLERLGPKARLLVVDCDEGALSIIKNRLGRDSRCIIERARFSELAQLIPQVFPQGVDGLMADLGISSFQLDDPGRGIGFLGDGPLDMRMDLRLEQTAFDLMEGLSESELASLIFEYGQERYSRKLARAIKYDVDSGIIRTTADLKRLAESVLGRFYRHQKIHPATRLFQALRMAVNDEVGELHALLDGLDSWIAPGGRVGIVSFHSLEDRLVKKKFVCLSKAGWRLVHKKPQSPTVEEIKNNPRSRSAKLRLIEKERG